MERSFGEVEQLAFAVLSRLLPSTDGEVVCVQSSINEGTTVLTASSAARIDSVIWCVSQNDAVCLELV